MSDDIKQWAGPIAPPDPAKLADIYAISQLAKVYALGTDMRDPDLVLSCFAEDGVGEGKVGSAPLHDYLRATYAGAAGFQATQHTMLNQHVTVDGDEATMWTYAVAYHIRPAGDPDGNLTVGVQYRDKARRTDKCWIIYRRRAVMQWSEGKFPEMK